MTQEANRVEDPSGILNEDDHQRDMTQVQMEVHKLARPSPSITRLTGRLIDSDPEQWTKPNLALRIEVESPEAARPITRVYTVRSFDAARKLVEIDFVMHEDDSPAMRWLENTRVGDRAWLTGPRPHFVPPFTDGKRAALFADDTAIPAIHAILSSWPDGIAGAVWVDTDDEAAFDSLPKVSGVDMTLLRRTKEEPAGTTRRLFKAARALEDPQEWTIWAAGERTEMRDLRKHFRGLKIARDALQVVGYWKYGASSSELDRERLANYEKGRAQGLRLEQIMDSEEAV
ncbi:siderophore-interacting protein [Roseovarius sp. M141]|uniref:siderophore-interacting protein n=1 Tax=Roseovarius sp. M141 TaxID=2583806 RepID=UPI0020CD005E|nr:siderophore-interacting protein [Roseovarius sp. M141]MCQ0091956.1 siderophore-interacting protein [Roseovarius sp. M141]